MDLPSFCYDGTKRHHRTTTLATSSQRLPKSNLPQKEDGATQLIKLIRLRLGKDPQRDISVHLEQLTSRMSQCKQCIAEESKMHERSLQQVRSVTKHHMLRRRIRPRKSSPRCCGASCSWRTPRSRPRSHCERVACNVGDERLRSHVVPLSLQLQQAQNCQYNGH